MTPTKASKNFGATHYLTMSNTKTPQMYYKHIPTKYSDSTSSVNWHYLSFANIWMGSSLTSSETLVLIQS